MGAAEREAERVAREAFGRLVAFLSARSGDVAGAEDALADALAAALARWPRDGVPRSPEAWLLTVARRRMADRSRHSKVVAAAAEHLRLAHEEAEAAVQETPDFPDERLGLLFACAHPAVDASARTPLMLQVVLGLDAGRIASAFLTSPATMTKRLTRAKAKIAEAGVPFSKPDPSEAGDRLQTVLAAIYAAYTLGWDDPAGADGKREGLTLEAIWLGRMTARLLPDEPEAGGLLALMLFCEARRHARRGAAGEFISIDQQATDLWDEAQLAEAEAILRETGLVGRIGRYQLEAAIQAVHAARRRGGPVDWAAIVHLYEGLVLVSPSIGARVGRAAALASAGSPREALAALEELRDFPVAQYQPYWATRAHVLALLGRDCEAATDYVRAAGLTEDAAVREFLLSRRRTLAN